MFWGCQLFGVGEGVRIFSSLQLEMKQGIEPVKILRGTSPKPKKKAAFAPGEENGDTKRAVFGRDRGRE